MGEGQSGERELVPVLFVGHLHKSLWSIDREAVGSSLKSSVVATKTFVVCCIVIYNCLLPRHNDSIQCVSYNPVTHQLASCSSIDFGRF